MVIEKMFWKVFGKTYNFINVQKYMTRYTKYLQKQGIIIEGLPNYISPDAYFDIQQDAKIKLGEGVVISKEVIILTHDYSIARGIQSIRGKEWTISNTPRFLKPVTVGDNTFIGARAILLPGCSIGKNCIVGAGSVVRGVIEDNSIVIGNPGIVISRTTEWAEKHIKKKDFLM